MVVYLVVPVSKVAALTWLHSTSVLFCVAEAAFVSVMHGLKYQVFVSRFSHGVAFSASNLLCMGLCNAV